MTFMLSHRMRRGFLVMMLGLLLVGVSGLVAATPVRAAGCYGQSCNGQDPIQMGCVADAYTPSGAYVIDSEGTTELRYSPACGANWAKISNSHSGAWFYAQNNHGDYQSFTVPSGYNNAYTAMVDGTKPARAGDWYSSTNWY